MNIYAQIVELLDSVVEEYREVVSSASNMAERGEPLDHYDLSKLIKANARADAARRVRLVIQNSTDADLPKVIQTIQASSKLDTRNSSGSTHFSVLSFYIDALEILEPKVIKV